MRGDRPPKTRILVESPMVGFCYTTPSPDAPPFVSVGSVVHRGTTLCLIETMMVFTEIPAGGTGTITEVLVENGQPVGFGQPLFQVVTTDPEFKSLSEEDFGSSLDLDLW
jgi:acetyl-CoA carboxylase biotin carboxyl carrier protein